MTDDCSAVAVFTCKCGAQCSANLFEVNMPGRGCTHIETRYLNTPPGWFIRVGYTLRDGEKYPPFVRCDRCAPECGKTYTTGWGPDDPADTGIHRCINKSPHKGKHRCCCGNEWAK